MNKPTAQAADADPSQCTSTDRSSKIAITFDGLQDLERSSLSGHGQFCNWKSYLKPFGLGGAVKLWEKKDDSNNQ